MWMKMQNDDELSKTFLKVSEEDLYVTEDACEDFRNVHFHVSSWFPHWLEKWENFFQSGNFEQTGKVRKF